MMSRDDVNVSVWNRLASGFSIVDTDIKGVGVELFS